MIWRQIQDEKSINFNHIVRKNNNTYYNKLFKKLNMREVKIVQMTEPNFQNFNDFPIIVRDKFKLNLYLLIKV